MKQQNLNSYPVDTPKGSLIPGASGDFAKPVSGLTEVSETVELPTGQPKTRTKASKAQEGSD